MIFPWGSCATSEGHAPARGPASPSASTGAPGDLATAAISPSPPFVEARARAFLRDSRGAAAVETAIVLAPFLALLIGCLQTGIVYFGQSALEVATEKSARLVLTGTAQGQNQAAFRTTVCSKLPSLLSCANVMVDAQVYASFSAADTSSPTIAYNSDGTVANTWNYNIGSAGDIVVLRVMYLMPVVGGPLNFTLDNAGKGKHLMMATAVFKNEPYQ